MHRNIKDMDRLCKIRDIQRAVNQFEQGFEKTYGICLNEELISSLKCEQIEIAPPLLKLLERSGTAE